MKNIIISILILSSIVLSETPIPKNVPIAFKDTLQTISKTDSLKIHRGSTGIIKGVVKDENGNLLKDALVFVVGKTWGDKTDEDGYYSIPWVRDGEYQLKCRKEGFLIITLSNIKVKARTTIEKNIILKPDSCSNRDELPIEIFQEEKVDIDHTQTVRKPVIYIYPEKETQVNIKLEIKGKLTTSYPTYPNEGWSVTAKPNGDLTTKDGKEYYSLYWEGVSEKPFTIDEGFVVKKENTIDFLEKNLKFLGLNSREANEFIIYWLPILEKSQYNLIHFSTTQYEEHAQLNITPKPETLIRVFMVFKGLDKPVKIQEQKLIPKTRKGYTVVEWGGCNMTDTTKSIVK